jgi:hypothetical protein
MSRWRDPELCDSKLEELRHGTGVDGIPAKWDSWYCQMPVDHGGDWHESFTGKRRWRVNPDPRLPGF